MYRCDSTSDSEDVPGVDLRVEWALGYEVQNYFVLAFIYAAFGGVLDSKRCSVRRSRRTR